MYRRTVYDNDKLERIKNKTVFRSLKSSIRLDMIKKTTKMFKTLYWWINFYIVELNDVNTDLNNTNK